MKEVGTELVVQRVLEKYPGVKPQIISDNGPQFIANDFKSFSAVQSRSWKPESYSLKCVSYWFLHCVFLPPKRCFLGRIANQS